jgi:hypothetical protein
MFRQDDAVNVGVRLRVDARDRLHALEDERSVVRPSIRTNNVISVYKPGLLAQPRCAERKRCSTPTASQIDQVERESQALGRGHCRRPSVVLRPDRE